MRAVVQRVSRAEVRVAGQSISRIGIGFLVLLGVALDDAEADADFLAEKVAKLRVFEDAEGRMNLGLREVGGAVLVVSQFTLLGECRKGRRPSFVHAAPRELAERLYERFAAGVRAGGLDVQLGQFRAHMEIELINDGPVTLLLDSRKLSL